MKTHSERLQKQLYDSLCSEYEKHYGDRWSHAYRDRFINDAMLRDIDVSGKQVLEAMCGSGETTGYLLKKSARVTGLDISEKEIERFRQRWPGCPGRCASIFETGFESDSFDCVLVMNGLHHVQPHVARAVREILRVLKPGGHFLFTEPHQGSFPDTVRRIWYRHDPFFAANEEAVDIAALKREFSPEFDFLSECYKGNLAYLLVLNSLIFRMPLTVKERLSPLLLNLEAVIESVQGKRLSCIAVSQWRKRFDARMVA